MRMKSITRKLSISMITMVIVTSLIITGGSLLIARYSAEKEMHEKAEELYSTVSTILVLPIWQLNSSLVEDIGTIYSQHELVSYITIKDKYSVLFEKKSTQKSSHEYSHNILYLDEVIGTVTIGISNVYFSKLLRQSTIIVFSLVIALIVALAFLIPLFIRIYLTLPILHFNEKISQMSLFGGTAFLEKETIIPEFSPIVDTLHDMQQTISSQYKDLEILNNTLEEKIKMRTAELENANSDLKDARIEADRANQAKSAFLANMSHEIRTPLNAIIGFSDILSDKINDEENRHFLRSIMSSSHTLLALINDVLDLSKVEAGKHELEYESVDIRNLVQEIDMMFRLKSNEKKLKWDVTVDEKVPAYLLLDPLRVRQVLINIVNNAFKFTSSGNVSLQLSCTSPGNTDLNTLLFEIHDTGVGIPEDEIQHIFEAFSQVKGQNFAEFGGTGLGLAISKNLVELMGGNIKVTSEMGAGTTFLIELAGVERSTPAKTIYKDFVVDEVSFLPAKVIIADDITENREVLREMLKPLQFTFFEAENGHDVLDILEDEPDVDCILLDIKMPVIDGITLTKILRKDPKYASIPLIAITASALHEEEIFIRQHCDGYLNKPVAKDELILELINFLPYKENKKQIVDVEEITENEQKVVLSSEELNILHDNLKNCKSLLEVQSIDKIEAFAKTINELSIEINSFFLKEWSSQVSKAISIFDLATVNNLLQEFQELGGIN